MNRCGCLALAAVGGGTFALGGVAEDADGRAPSRPALTGLHERDES